MEDVLKILLLLKMGSAQRLSEFEIEVSCIKSFAETVLGFHDDVVGFCFNAYNLGLGTVSLLFDRLFHLLDRLHGLRLGPLAIVLKMSDHHLQVSVLALRSVTRPP